MSHLKKQGGCALLTPDVPRPMQQCNYCICSPFSIFVTALCSQAASLVGIQLGYLISVHTS